MIIIITFVLLNENDYHYHFLLGIDNGSHYHFLLPIAVEKHLQ